MLDREHVAAVSERQADGDVEPVVPWLHRRSVERAGRRAHGGASALGAAVRVPLDTRLVEQRLDTSVRRGLERVSPPRRPTGALADLLAPALDHLRLACRAPLLDERLDDLVQLRPGGVRLGVRPADDRVRDLGRQCVLELRARLVAADDDDARPTEPAEAVLDLLDDRLVMVVLQLLDMPLVPRLRPPALIVAAGCVGYYE